VDSQLKIINSLVFCVVKYCTILFSNEERSIKNSIKSREKKSHKSVNGLQAD